MQVEVCSHFLSSSTVQLSNSTVQLQGLQSHAMQLISQIQEMLGAQLQPVISAVEKFETVMDGAAESNPFFRQLKGDGLSLSLSLTLSLCVFFLLPKFLQPCLQPESGIMEHHPILSTATPQHKQQIKYKKLLPSGLELQQQQGASAFLRPGALATTRSFCLQSSSFGSPF